MSDSELTPEEVVAQDTAEWEPVNSVSVVTGLGYRIDRPSRQCFAYNQQAQRCDQIAGHEGLHSISVDWSDEECFDPTVVTLVHPSTGMPEFTSIVTDADLAGEPTAQCVVCLHMQERHGVDGCVAKNAEGDECGCREFV
jgi:hypothetical protein